MQGWLEGRDGRRKGASHHAVVALPNGERGYGMDPYRWDDCLQAAIATATQVPIEQVPDLGRLHDRWRNGEDADEINVASWGRIANWATKRGLMLMLHADVPAPRRRWIGVVCNPVSGQPSESPFQDHALVMCHGDLIFDPMCTVEPPPGHRLDPFPPSDITYGISFDPTKEE